MFKEDDEAWIAKLKDPKQRKSYFKISTFWMCILWGAAIVSLVGSLVSKESSLVPLGVFFLLFALFHQSEMRTVRLFVSLLKENENFEEAPGDSAPPRNQS